MLSLQERLEQLELISPGLKPCAILIPFLKYDVKLGSYCLAGAEHPPLPPVINIAAFCHPGPDIVRILLYFYHQQDFRFLALWTSTRDKSVIARMGCGVHQLMGAKEEWEWLSAAIVSPWLGPLWEKEAELVETFYSWGSAAHRELKELQAWCSYKIYRLCIISAFFILTLIIEIGRDIFTFTCLNLSVLTCFDC